MQLFATPFKRAAKAGEALFVAGDRGDGCYRVEQGLVKITVTSDWGEERIIALVGTLTLTIRQAMNRSRPNSVEPIIAPMDHGAVAFPGRLAERSSIASSCS